MRSTSSVSGIIQSARRRFNADSSRVRAAPAERRKAFILNDLCSTYHRHPGIHPRGHAEGRDADGRSRCVDRQRGRRPPGSRPRTCRARLQSGAGGLPAVALRRASRNLLENAGAHGVRATARVADDDGRVFVVIEDDGPGIPEADLERMFEPCVRLGGSRSGDAGGAGRGLATPRTIIRGHGGDIRLENRTEGGLRATVVLPESGGGRSRDGRGVCDRPRFHWPRVTDARAVPGNGLQLNPHGTDSRRACIAALPSPLSSRTTSVLSGVSAPTASVARAQVRLALPPAAAPRPTVPAVQVSLPRVTPPAHRFDGDGHAGRACSHHAVLTRLCDRQHRRHRAEASGDTARRAMMPPAAVQSAPEHGVFDKHGRALGKTRMYALVTRRDSLEHRPILQGIIGFPRESSPPDPRSRRLGCFLASTPGNSPAGRGFGPVQHFLALPLKRRSG